MMAGPRAAIARFVASAASDRPPRAVRSWRVMGYPCQYCVTVVVVGILTLLLRPLLPHATGATYGGVRGANGIVLAILLSMPLAFAFYEPRGGAFIFVCVTAMARGIDSLSPLSVAPFALYCVLVPCQLAIWCRIDLVPVLARRIRGDRHAAER
jgi:hypothetical protein